MPPTYLRKRGFIFYHTLENIVNSYIDTIYDQNQLALYAGTDVEQLKTLLD